MIEFTSFNQNNKNNPFHSEVTTDSSPQLSKLPIRTSIIRRNTIQKKRLGLCSEQYSKANALSFRLSALCSSFIIECLLREVMGERIWLNMAGCGKQLRHGNQLLWPW